MYKENFHVMIKNIRISKGYTQQYVADNTGLSQVSIARWESGTREPNIESLGMLIDFYGVSADDVLGTGKRE